MSSIKVFINTNSPCKDGTYPLAIQLISNRNKKVARISYSLFKEDFDSNTCKAKYREGINHYQYTEQEVNNQIIKEVALLNDVLDYLQEFSPEYTAVEAMSLYKIARKTPLFSIFAAKQANLYEQRNQLATANAYKSALKKVLAYTGNHLLKFEEIDSKWLATYNEVLVNEELKENSIFFYLRILRVIYNKAQKMGVVSLAQNPFINQKYQALPVEKDVLKPLDIALLAQATFKEDDNLELIRDLFLFSYYSCGMSYMDMASIRKIDIQGDTMTYIRKRNKKKTTVSITPHLRMIINKYKDSDSEYLLPIFTAQNHSFQDYRKKLRCYNSQLKKLTERLDLSCPLNSYVALNTSNSRENVGEITLSLVSKGKKSTTKIAYSSLEEVKDLLLKALEGLNKDCDIPSEQ